MEEYSAVFQDFDQRYTQLERKGAAVLRNIASNTSHLLSKQKEIC